MMEVIFYCFCHERLMPHVQSWTEGHFTRYLCVECLWDAWLAILKLVGEEETE